MDAFRYETDWWYDDTEGDEYEVRLLRRLDPPCDEAPRGKVYVLQDDALTVTRGAAAREREAVLAFLAHARIECVADGDTRYGSFVEGLEDAIRNGEHYATLQLGEASSLSPEASADSMEKPSTNGSEGESG